MLACGEIMFLSFQEESLVSQINAKFSTDRGEINLKLFAEQAPLTVANFINLAKQGFYDGLSFHRVIKDPPFMVQGGCPEGSGRGGPGYKFEDECNANLRHSKPGVLSMANSGPNTNGSQFFITHTATPWLDGKHTVFGEVISDTDLKVINNIEQGDNIKSVEIVGDYEELLKTKSERIAEWNKTLAKKFPVQ